MVDRIHERSTWTSIQPSAESLCRSGDDLALRDILTSSLWGTLKFSQKFAYVKGIVKDLPCEAKAARLLRKWVFGHRRALLRPDSVDSTGTSIAHWAAQRDHPTPLFKTLKDLGAPLSRNNKAGMSPLHFLFWKSGPMGENRLREAARFLVNCGCPIDLRENSGESPLHVACLRKDPLAAFKVLADLGADLLMKTNKGETALHLVAASCCPQRILLAFQFLLDHGADPTLKDASEKTVLYYVFERKEIKQETRLAITKLLRPDFGSRSGCASGSSLGGGRCDSESELSLIGSDQPIMSPSEKMSVDFSDSALGSVGSPGVSSRPDLFQVPLQPTNQTARYSPYEPRPARPRQRSSTQDLYPIATSNYQITVGTSTDDLTAHSYHVTRRPVCLIDSGQILNPQECPCPRCEKELLAKTEAEIGRIRISDMERERDELKQELARAKMALERHENCPICVAPYTISSRRTLKSCGHVMCVTCANQWLESERAVLSQSESAVSDSPGAAAVEKGQEPAACPVCRTPYTQSDLVKSLIS